jgi:hypothetical protein
LTSVQKASTASGIPLEELEALLALPYKKDINWIAPAALKDVSFARGSQEVINEIRGTLATRLERRKAKDREKVNLALRLILSNLVYSVFARTPLAIPNNHKTFLTGGLLKKLFLSKNATRDVLQALVEEGYISKTRGSFYKKEVNRYKPTDKLKIQLIPLIYCVAEVYDEVNHKQYVSIKSESNKERAKRIIKNRINQETLILALEPEVREGEREQQQVHIIGASSLPDNHPDIINLKKINDFLKHVNFALKAPVRLIYTKDPFHGGRLYVPIQNLPDRKVKVRINTLINGNPVCEVDLSASHLRIAAALNAIQLPEDPYIEIAVRADVTRDQVKFLLTRAFGAKDRRLDLKENGIFIISTPQRTKIEEVTKELYPEVFDALYKGMGSAYQSLEGAVLMKAMSSLIDLGIPSLPIHDAIMVQQEHVDQAKTALENAWMDVLNVNFRPYTTIDMP